MLSKEKIQIVENVLKKFIFSIRVGGQGNVCSLVFCYYTSGYEDTEKRPDVHHLHEIENFYWTKKQITGKILSKTNTYWNLEESKIKFVEDLAINHTKEFDSFEGFIEKLWKEDINTLSYHFEAEEKEELSKQDEQLKLFLKDKYDILHEVVKLIMSDEHEFPCKSDKIKIFLELELDVDTIYAIMGSKEKWVVQRGYVDKYKKERDQAIKEKKIKIYDLNSTIKDIKRRIH